MGLREAITKITSSSPLQVGTEFKTEDLVGHEVEFNNCDIVSYDEKGTGKHVEYSVWSMKDGTGYYCGGTTLTDIASEIMADPDYMEELRKDGIKVILEKTQTKSGNSYVKVRLM